MRIYLRHRFVNLFSLCTLLRNSIGGVVRDVWHCSGMGRQHVLATGSLAPSCGCAAQRLALRETLLPRPPDDARSALPIPAPACVSCGKRCARTACPHHAACPCGGGGVTPWLAAFAPPAVRGIFSTILRASLGGLQRKHRWRTSCVNAVLALSWGELTENRKQRQHVRPGFLFPKQEVVMDFVIFFTGIAAVACALYYLKKTNPNKPHAH